MSTAVMNIFTGVRELQLEVCDVLVINPNHPEPLVILGAILSSLLIILVSSIVIKDLMKMQWTFVNFMVLVDCILSVCHIPLIFQAPL